MLRDPLVERADDADLHHHPEQADHDRRGQHRRQETDVVAEAQRQVGAQHVEGGVGEVDDADQTENDVEAQRQQHVDGAEDDAVEEEVEELVDPAGGGQHCH